MLGSFTRVFTVVTVGNDALHKENNVWPSYSVNMGQYHSWVS